MTVFWESWRGLPKVGTVDGKRLLRVSVRVLFGAEEKRKALSGLSGPFVTFFLFDFDLVMLAWHQAKAERRGKRQV